MEDKLFLEACHLINSKLCLLKVNKVSNSIGSNVFFDFGVEKEIVFKNGKKTLQKEWSIWLSWISWKIMKNGKYIVGSGDSRELIQLNIEQLLKKQFQSLQFTSQFLDPVFHFSEGYQITTLFNRLEENQWTIFLPHDVVIGPDYSNEESLQNMRNLVNQLTITKTHHKVWIPKNKSTLEEITYSNIGEPTMQFSGASKITFKNCVWRLEKDGQYQIGYLDNNQKAIKHAMNQLIGKNLLEIVVINDLDAEFVFEDQYVLKTFIVCCGKSPFHFKDLKKLFLLQEKMD